MTVCCGTRSDRQNNHYYFDSDENRFCAYCNKNWEGHRELKAKADLKSLLD